MREVKTAPAFAARLAKTAPTFAARLAERNNVSERGWLEVAHGHSGELPGEHRLGEIMVSLGMIDHADRDAVLARQRKLKLPFGECCRRLKLVNPKELSRALALQFGSCQSISGATPCSEDLVMLSQPFGSYAEVVRSVSARLMSKWVGKGHNALAIASAEKGEGRSHVAANFAVGLAQAGWRTLLIDADFREPKQHAIFNVPQHPGLSRVLCGFAPKNVVHQIAHFKCLALITSGPVPPNASELLSRDSLTLFLGQAKASYDVVLVDTPAGSSFSDAELIASAAGSALIVIRKSHTRQRGVVALADRCAENGVQIAGTLLNVH